MKKDKLYNGGFLLLVYIIVAVFFLIGWIKDINHLINCDFKPSYKAEILYGVGAVTGLGAIFGWIDFGK